jgi:hypothetical protein
MARRDSGQAAVETALTMPLLLFMILGSLQLFLMLQGRIMANYAAFNATRVGSTSHGNCDRMVDAAVLSVLPTFHPFLTRGGGGTPGQKLAATWDRYRNNTYNNKNVSDGGDNIQFNGAIVWLAREQPRAEAIRALRVKQDTEFDQPIEAHEAGDPNKVRRLEVRLIYWFPLQIPFANWVISKILLVNFSLASYTALNPMMVTEEANWTPGNSGGATLEPAIAAEMVARHARKEFVMPIEATYTMRMMTPAKATNFRTQHCPPTPETL